MKKVLLFLPVVLFLLYGCKSGNHQQKTKGFTIRGHISGISSGSVKLVSTHIEDHSLKALDSAFIINGSFTLKGNVQSPRMMSLLIEPGNWSFSVFIEDTLLSISADTSGARYYDYTKYGDGQGAYINRYTESGSKNFDAVKQFQNDPRQKQYEPVLSGLHRSFEAAKDKAGEYRVMDQMDSVNTLLRIWQMSWIDSFVNRNPSLVAGAYMFYNAVHGLYYSIPVTTLERTINRYKGEAKASIYYKSLRASLAKIKAVQPGSIAPDFTLLKTDSSKLTLSSTRGKYIMIDFWASWCLPCRQAIPHWKEIYQKYRNKGLDIVGVASDRQWNAWIKALNQEKMPWIQLKDEFPDPNNPLGKVGNLYLTRSIPFYVLLDKEGRILIYSSDEHKIDTKLKEVFGS